jgi:hypothetical protein
MFTGDLSRKTLADLGAFLAEDLPEDVRLDYKRDFPANLEKTIAAMANTEGGLILVGVDEDRDRPRYPVHTPVGVPADQAVERVMSKAYQAIYEPLVPEAQAVLLEDAERCVVVIRVQPSERAPHAVAGRRDVYRRVGPQSLPAGADLDERADLPLLDWLLRRRADNQTMIGQAVERAGALLPAEAPRTNVFRARLVIQPALSHAEPLSVAALQRLASSSVHAGYFEFPPRNMRLVAGGLFDDRAREAYVDVVGLSCYQREFNIEPSLPNVVPSPASLIRPSWAARRARVGGPQRDRCWSRRLTRGLVRTHRRTWRCPRHGEANRRPRLGPPPRSAAACARRSHCCGRRVRRRRRPYRAIARETGGLCLQLGSRRDLAGYGAGRRVADRQLALTC